MFQNEQQNYISIYILVILDNALQIFKVCLEEIPILIYQFQEIISLNLFRQIIFQDNYISLPTYYKCAGLQRCNNFQNQEQSARVRNMMSHESSGNKQEYISLQLLNKLDEKMAESQLLMLLIEAIQNAKLGRSRFILYIQSKSSKRLTSIDQFINYIRDRLNAFSITSVERQAEKMRVIRLLEKQQKRLKEEINSAYSQMDGLKRFKKLFQCSEQRKIAQTSIKLLLLQKSNQKVFSEQLITAITNYYEKLIQIVDDLQKQKDSELIIEKKKEQKQHQNEQYQNQNQYKIMKQGTIKADQSKSDKQSVQLSKKIVYDKKSLAPKYQQDRGSYQKDMKYKYKNQKEQIKSIRGKNKSEFEAYFGSSNIFLENCQIKFITQTKKEHSS